jgi:alpha-glucan,water dikinase
VNDLHTPETEVTSRFPSANPPVEVHVRRQNGRLLVDVDIRSDDECLLHWGLSSRSAPGWRLPPAELIPPGAEPFDAHALRTPCSAAAPGHRLAHIELDSRIAARAPHQDLSFVVYFPDRKRWVKDRGKDFHVPLPRPDSPPSPSAALAGLGEEDGWQHRSFDLGDGETLATAIREEDRQVRVALATDLAAPVLLHWGLAIRSPRDWQLPPPALRPPGSSDYDGRALRTPFEDHDGLRRLTLELSKGDAGELPRGLQLVLYQADSGRWRKHAGHDIYLALRAAPDSGTTPERLRDPMETIVAAETGRGSWTLMHRFNLCYDLLDAVQDDPDGLALLFAWLRFSAIRQLDWQRNYNTQPRELSHAQERLTLRLAEHYARGRPDARGWVRRMLSTLGRGGEGQKVRDEILNIMHRHHIKEMHGHFMEEWHQKLHNNTTPDDVVICEAYLGFLYGYGDRDAFYSILARSGVSRERLRGFERPIRTDPEYYPDKRDGLIHDFEGFLRILKSVHSGTDLDTAAGPARGVLDPELNGVLDRFYAQRGEQAAPSALMETITELREGLARQLQRVGEAHAVRDLLYLDLALEQVLRGLGEQGPGNAVAPRPMAETVWRVLRNLALGEEAGEARLCADQLQSLLAAGGAEDREWALQLKSITDRASDLVSRDSEALHARLQPLAETLGRELGVEDWTLPLFGEEVIRAEPGFLYSLVLRRLDPLLRRLAGIGGWQVISPARAAGRARPVDDLRKVQGERFDQPTVLIADRVEGDEEIPDGVTAVITTDTPDLVSHVAVRARNGQVLFATCYDSEPYQALKGLRGTYIALEVGVGGEVTWHRAEAGTAGGEPVSEARSAIPLRLRPKGFDTWVLTQDRFDAQRVGGKSNNLQALRGRLADWIRLPTSLALPFGVFEHTLEQAENHGLAEALSRLQGRIEAGPEPTLEQIRALLVQDLAAPPALRDALQETWSRAALPDLEWDTAWDAIKRVWASKWNARAWYSRRNRGIDDGDLSMAVLIQETVAADYAFVLHTHDPVDRDPGRIYAEVVLGLGETLVGNYPGRALGASIAKADLAPTLQAYPSKHVGLYGGGLMFRSDSNGEDLERFAGAGLYDSIAVPPPRERLLDYRSEPLVTDASFRDRMLRRLARIGLEIERCFGSPQDIEGAVRDEAYYVVQTRPQVGVEGSGRS